LPSNSQKPTPAAGSKNRLAGWFLELRAPLRRFVARRRGLSSADVEDVAQEVFLRLLRFDQSELIIDPKRYLFTVASNVASEWSARASKRTPHASEWLDDLEDEASVIDDSERASRDAALHRALAALQPRAREILRLHFGDGLTREAIARRLDISHRVVKREILNAYARLRVMLSDNLDQGVTNGTFHAAASVVKR
jgi:RNA polymerase sigma factor (sigma-70 family)